MPAALRENELDLEIYHREPDHILGVADVVHVAVALEAPSGLMATALIKGLKRTIESRGVAAIYALADERGKPPDDAARTAIRRLVSSLPPKCKGLGIFFEGVGFGAAAKRAATSVVILAVRPPVPLHVSATAEGAIGWVYERLGTDAPAIAPASIVDAAERLRRQARPPK